MRGRRFYSRRLCLLLSLLAFLGIVGAAPAHAWQMPPGERPAQFIVISDFHFDPFDSLTREQFAQLAAAPIDDWTALLAGQPTAAYGRDAPCSLVQSALASAREQLPNPAFILFPGDFFAHGWQNKYDRMASRSRTDDPEAYRAFSSRVMQFLARLVHSEFPKTAFLPVLGNDDSFCGDYMIGPESPFLKMCSEVWEPLLHLSEGSPERTAFAESCARGGYYTVRLPGFPKHRLMALNTVFFSKLYDNACGVKAATPAVDELAWLEKNLASAKEANESVWLLMHIPPGIDSYSSNRNGGTPETFWQPDLLARFLDLLERYRTTIQFAFAGHTHMDDFRVARVNGEARLLTKIVPAVSPIFGNNPGYQIFDADREGKILDYTTHFLSLSDSIAGQIPPWQPEYEFRRTYNQPSLTASTIIDLSNQIRTEGPARTAYIRNYSVGAKPPAIPPRLLNCSVLNVTPEEFMRCMKGD
jgi:hypothetical protein